MVPFPKFVRLNLEPSDHSRFLDWLEEHFSEGQYMDWEQHVYIDKASYLAMARPLINAMNIPRMMHICCICEEDVAQISLSWDAVEV